MATAVFGARELTEKRLRSGAKHGWVGLFFPPLRIWGRTSAAGNLGVMILFVVTFPRGNSIITIG